MVHPFLALEALVAYPVEQEERPFLALEALVAYPVEQEEHPCLALEALEACQEVLEALQGLPFQEAQVA